MPHVLRDNTVTVIPWQSYDNAVSAGSVISNVTELAQWLRLLLGEGRYGGRELITRATFREMFRPQSVLLPTGWIAMVDSLSPSTHFWSYGLGWRMNDYRGRKIDAVAAAEARGFLFAAPLALNLHRPLIPFRKPGKLPHTTHSLRYELEYGEAELHVHTDAIHPGSQVLLVDDLLGTGGTMKAACDLVEKAGGEVAACAFLVELSFLGGGEKLAPHEVFSLIRF